MSYPPLPRPLPVALPVYAPPSRWARLRARLAGLVLLALLTTALTKCSTSFFSLLP